MKHDLNHVYKILVVSMKQAIFFYNYPVECPLKSNKILHLYKINPTMDKDFPAIFMH